MITFPFVPYNFDSPIIGERRQLVMGFTGEMEIFVDLSKLLILSNDIWRYPINIWLLYRCPMD